MLEPQEIEDEEHEQILERVAAIDVAKSSGMVCVRAPDPARPGRRRNLVWQVDATMNAVLELADHLVGQRVQKVTLGERLLAHLVVRREALFDPMEVRDRPSACCRSSGPELEAA